MYLPHELKRSAACRKNELRPRLRERLSVATAYFKENAVAGANFNGNPEKFPCGNVGGTPIAALVIRTQ
jgi:hypothetical protein